MRLSNFLAPIITVALLICAVVGYYLLKDEVITRDLFMEWYGRFLWFVFGGVAASFIEGLISTVTVGGGPKR